MTGAKNVFYMTPQEFSGILENSLSKENYILIFINFTRQRFWLTAHEIPPHRQTPDFVCNLATDYHPLT
jgi:hypothetical protein